MAGVESGLEILDIRHFGVFCRRFKELRTQSLMMDIPYARAESAYQSMPRYLVDQLLRFLKLTFDGRPIYSLSALESVSGRLTASLSSDTGAGRSLLEAKPLSLLMHSAPGENVNWNLIVDLYNSQGVPERREISEFFTRVLGVDLRAVLSLEGMEHYIFPKNEDSEVESRVMNGIRFFWREEEKAYIREDAFYHVYQVSLVFDSGENGLAELTVHVGDAGTIRGAIQVAEESFKRESLTSLHSVKRVVISSHEVEQVRAYVNYSAGKAFLEWPSIVISEEEKNSLLNKIESLKEKISIYSMSGNIPALKNSTNELFFNENRMPLPGAYSEKIQEALVSLKVSMFR